MESDNFNQHSESRHQHDQSSSESGLQIVSDQSDNQNQKSTLTQKLNQIDLSISQPNETQHSEKQHSNLQENVVSKKQAQKSQHSKPSQNQQINPQNNKNEKLTTQKREPKPYKEETKNQPTKQKKRKSQRPSRSSQISSQNKQTRSKSKKYVQIEGNQEWNAKAIQSDEGQGVNQLEEEGEQNQNQQQSAFLDEEDVNNLTTQNNDNEMNNAYIEKQVNIKYEHWVENKHLLVLYLLFRKQIYDMFPKKFYNRIDIHPSYKNKIKIFGTNQQEIKEISSKISEMINKIAIVKLNIRNQEAVRLKSSKLLNKKMLKDRMVIFRFGNPNDKSYYLGGKGTQPQLSCFFKEIRNLKFRYFRMFDYPNTRSYHIILGHFINQKELLKAFIKWNLKNLEIVPFIPDFSNNFKNKKDKEKSLCFLMTTIGNMESFSPKEIQNNLTPFIKNNFYSIVLIFKKREKFLPKLNVEGIIFKYVYERKFSWAYVYILCLKKDFFQKRAEIIKEVEKLSEKNIIFGVRYFNHLSPERSEYIRPDIYKEVKYPEDRAPYSYSIISRKITHQDQKLATEVKEQGQEVKESQMKEIKQKKYYKFDWEAHLMNLQSTEISFIEQKN